MYQCSIMYSSGSQGTVKGSRREEDGVEGNMSSRWHQNQLKKKGFGGAFGLWSERQGDGTGIDQSFIGYDI